MSVSRIASDSVAYGGTYPWLRSKRWDLTYISLSAALVSLPIILHYHLGASRDLVNILVAILVGGPHMYATFSVTFLERRFVQQYPVYAGSALIIPVLVIVGALTNLTLLLTIFMFWASIHVLHQICYLVDCYRRKGQEPEGFWNKAIDYAAVFTSLYPFAAEKLVSRRFILEDQILDIPVFMRNEYTVYAAWAVFLIAQSLFIGKTASEFVRGTVNVPKVILMSITIVVAFIIPSFDNLDVAFQGLNTWHSFQYLAMMYYLNELRRERGEISSSFIRNLLDGWGGPKFYVFNVGITVAAAVTVGMLVLFFGMGFYLQSYYIVILSCLLMHYYFDHFLFMRTPREIAP